MIMANKHYFHVYAEQFIMLSVIHNEGVILFPTNLKEIERARFEINCAGNIEMVLLMTTTFSWL